MIRGAWLLASGSSGPLFSVFLLDRLVAIDRLQGDLFLELWAMGYGHEVTH
jgi:hypothetical protein